MSVNKNEYANKVKEEINAWEKECPGYLSNVTSFVLWPAMKAAELLIFDAVTQTGSKVIEGCLNALLWDPDYTVADKDVIATLKEKNNDFSSLKAVYNSDDLENMDLSADYYWNYNLVYAVAQGGANIPALFTIVFRCIQQIALCYGFDTSKDDEKVFMLGIISIASASDVASKQAAMVFMRQIQVDITKKFAEEGGRAAIEPIVRQVAKTIGINLTKRKAHMLIPGIGAIAGASFDGMYLQDIARAAKNCYRKRKLEMLGKF